MDQLLWVGGGHGAIVEGGADTSLTPRGQLRSRSYTFDVFQISVLGPIEVRRDGQLVRVPGGKASELLVRLAVEAGQLVRTDRLVDDLWAAEAVTTRRNTLAVEDREAAPSARRLR